LAVDLGSAFVKRRLNLQPGAMFMPWDQINYVIGNFIVLGPLLKLNLSVWYVLFIATFFLAYHRQPHWICVWPP